MSISRRDVLMSGTAVLIAAYAGRPGTARASTPSTFDYYMSPTGDDNNAGTLAAPWSITALNSKGSTYAGKSVGLLPGTYRYGVIGGVQTSLWSMLNSSVLALTVNGGTSAASTYIASSDASGNYSPRTAILDGSNPTTGAQPTGSGYFIGQNNPAGNAGYITYDGITVRNFNYTAIGHGGSPFAFPGLVIQNCEIYNGGGVPSSNNPGAIFVWKQAPGMRISNCLIHDLTTVSGGANSPWGMAGIMFNQDAGSNEGFTASIDHCSIYRVGQCITTKNNYSNVSVSYCYLELVNMGIYTGSAFPFAIYAAQQAPGTTVNFHHNVIMGGVFGHGEDGTSNAGAVVATNNTFYCGPTAGNKPANGFFAYNNTSTASLTFNHNIGWSDGGYDNSGLTGPIGAIGFSGGGTNVFDYDYYGSGCTFGGAGGSDTTFANWQKAGQDSHSSTMSSTPFVSTPASLNIASFIVATQYLTTSDGNPCGALNSSGLAADGSGIVGCNFASSAPIPNAPVLSIG
jgi:hypothetical protein